MARWEGWQRTRHDPDTPPDAYQQSLARKVLGELMEGIRRGGLFQNKIVRRFSDGTVVTAQFDGTTPMVEVQSPSSSVARPVPVLSSLWIPRGFVFVPGTAATPQGWGLPVVRQDGDTDWPFGSVNLDPGLEVTRWTANGPAAQVLVTTDDTAKYPDPQRQMLPIGYDAKEWRASMSWKPKASTWHVTRATFQGFDWTPDVRGARIALWRSVTGELAKNLMALPFAGFYDDAQVFAALSAKYGADDTVWPFDYATTPVRADKDGYRGAYSESRFANGTPQQLAGGLTLPDAAVLVDVGVSAGITTATERPAKDWIQCGNQFWHPDDPALPTLTWDGYPAQNLPLWLLEGGWVDQTGGDIFPLEGWHYEWRGQTRYVFSKNLYAMGRCIGVLPDTVLSAAIRKETIDLGAGKTKQVNRVVVLTWRASDQAWQSQYPSNASYGWLAYLWKFRVWCADFDASADVPLRVATVPVGAYDATTNPTGWRECGSFETDTMEGALEAGLPRNSPWQIYRFNGDGSKAIASFGPLYVGGGQVEFWGGQFARELAFVDVAPGVLNLSASTRVSEFPYLLAADYAGDAVNCVFLLPSQAIPFPLKPTTTPVGGPCAPGEGIVFWGLDGAWEPLGDSSDYDAPPFSTPECWVLDAATGAMAFLDYWNVCELDGPRFDVRLTMGGERIDVSFAADTANVAQGVGSTSTWLDRLNAGFARDRDGHYIIGYDLGTTAGSTVVYSYTPVCGEFFPPTVPAPVSSYFGSRWLFDGVPIDLEGLPAAPMRAFPIGVC